MPKKCCERCVMTAFGESRHYVLFAGLTWEIDVYEGILKGVVIAEVELDREDRILELPMGRKGSDGRFEV